MRVAPARVETPPQQYFRALRATVARHASSDGEPLIDLARRANPETGPPPYVAVSYEKLELGLERLARALR
jgi:hypothetical protein